MPSKRVEGEIRWAIDLREEASQALRSLALEIGERGGGRVVARRLLERLASDLPAARVLLDSSPPVPCSAAPEAPAAPPAPAPSAPSAPPEPAAPAAAADPGPAVGPGDVPAPSRRGPDELAAFAAEVMAAAEAIPVDRRWGPARVYLSDVLDGLGRTRVIDRGTFERMLVAADKANMVELSRADLVEAMDPKRLAQSKIIIPGAWGGEREVNLMRLRESAPGVPRGMGARLRASAPAAPLAPAPAAPAAPAAPPATAPERIERAIEREARRLGVDVLDLPWAVAAWLRPLATRPQEAAELSSAYAESGRAALVATNHAETAATALGLAAPRHGLDRSRVLHLGEEARAWLSSRERKIYDSESRPYTVTPERRRLLRGTLDGLAIHDRPGPFQSRDLRTGPERAKIERMAAAWDAERSARTDTGTPTEGAPVVWIDHNGYAQVVAGNGRALAAIAAADAAGRAGESVPVRVLLRAGERRAGEREAAQLAAASQESSAGAQTDLGRAAALVASLGLGPGDGPRFVPAGGLSRETLPQLVGDARNAEWLKKLRLSGVAERDAERVRLALIGTLPAEVLAVAAALGPRAEAAIAGAAPRIASMCAAVGAGRLRPEFCLRSLFREAAEALASIGAHPGESDARYADRLAAWTRTPDLYGQPHRLSRLAAGFLLALRRFASGSHKDPAAAFDEALARLENAAYAPGNVPGQGSLFGPSDPVDVVAIAFGQRIASGAEKAGRDGPE